MDQAQIIKTRYVVDLGTPARDTTVHTNREEGTGLGNCRAVGDEDSGLNLSRRSKFDGDGLKPQNSALRIGTWNVRTLYRPGKLENCLMQMDDLKLDILGISEVRWTDNGKVNKEDHSIIYSGGRFHKNGVGIILRPKAHRALMGYWPISERVIMAKFKSKPFNLVILQVYAPTCDYSDEDVDLFYEEIETGLQSVKSTDILIVMGDLNAKVGKGKYKDIVGDYGLGSRNERGNRLIEFCVQHELMISNTWFQHPKRRLYTWKSPGDSSRNQIDFIMVNKRFRNCIKQVKTYPGADIRSDHNPVVGKIKFTLKALKKSESKKLHLDLNMLKNGDMKKRFATEVHNNFDALIVEESEQQPDILWDSIKNSVLKAAEDVIPKKDKVAKQHWMNEDILMMMTERKRNKNISSKYKELDEIIKKKCKKAKEEWLEKKCDEIETLEKKHHSKEMHKLVKELTNKNTRTAGGCIKDKNGRMLFETEEIDKRWVEYITELYSDNREEQIPLDNLDGPKILNEEVLNAIKKLKGGKACGLDGVAAEMIKALEVTEVERITSLCNVIYDSGNIPKDLVTSEFIKIPKKSKSVNCTDYRTISLISHTSKVLLIILIERIKVKIYNEIAENQSGFMPRKGTREGIFSLRMVAERYLEKKKNIYVCFIDYEKAFDRVNHAELINCLKKIGLDGKDIRFISNLYWTQVAVIRTDNGNSEKIKILKGVRQGCIISPILFILYSEMIFRALEELKGVVVGGRNITNLRYADDTALLSESEENLQKIVDKVNEEGEKMGMSINVDKSKTMVITRYGKENIQVDITVDGKRLQQVDAFIYLGQLVTADGKCEGEIRRRMGIARTVFLNMREVLTSRNIRKKVKIRLVKCYVWSTLLYGVETWTISALMLKMINAFEMWCLRRVLKISWRDKIKNETVLKKAGCRRELEGIIKMRKASYAGHVLRSGDSMQKNCLEGYVEGKRERGRQRATWMDNIKDWAKLKYGGVARKAEDREEWRSMVVNLSKKAETALMID